ncbi:DNA-binding CsgD family transcriptional regulator/tetratricopeptide (TPR) repeat protein [Microbacterium sp. W4I4]|uniref:ATP-binding protein n=1 Tax=Microbacterium sp. W4I4 TaxID=3042295 RepID=UPI00278A016B|nr:AAA family ATPase [Microbacterium sp. W4I4]MDQ0615391.1 DNA-binding CsgD family transcriptional regulator/tetratricopeptide (TPR) repeat protein [Microbacterium sp. W4I4]
MPVSALPTVPPGRLFLGREAEVERVIEALGPGSSSGLVVSVQGEVGIGKTSLIEAVLAREPQGRRILRGATDAMDRRRPFGLLLDALADVLDEDDQRVAAEQSEQIAGERLLAIIEEVAREPALLVLEDLHWADAASLRLLTRLSRTLDQLPLAIIASLRTQARHETVPALDRLLSVLSERGLLHSIVLDPLPEETCLAIAENLTGARVEGELARYTTAAGGNPLFLTEMIRALLRDGAVTLGGRGEALLDAPIGPSPSLATIMMRHLSHLSPQTRELLTTAALLGTRFSPSQLRLVADQPMSELLPLLRESFAAGFIEEIDDDTFGFRHQLIQDVLLHDQPAAVRAELHREVAVTLDAANVSPATVADHLLQAPTAGTDLPWLLRLARRTVTAAPLIAVELWDRVVAGTDAADPMHVSATAGLARAALSAGRAQEAGRLAESALDHAGATEAGTMLRAIELRALLMQHEHTAAHERAMGYAAVQIIEPAERAAHLAFAGWPLFMLGDVEGARRTAREGAELAAEHGNHGARVYALALQGQIASCRGELDEAITLQTEAVSVADRHPSLTAIEAFPHALLAIALADVDRSTESVALVHRGLQVSEQFGYRTGILATHTLAAQARSHSGHLSDIAAELEAHRALLGSMEIRLDPPVRGLRAHVIAQQSGPAAALDAAAQLDPVPGRDLWGGRGRSWVWLGLSQTARARGDAAATLEVLRRGWQELSDADMAMDCAEMALDLIQLSQQVAHDPRTDPAGRARSTDEVDEVVALVARLAAKNPSVVHLQATALATAGLSTGDAALLIEAEQRMSATPRLLDHARIAELAALALPADDARGGSLADTALHAYAEVGADHQLTRARASFRQAGVPVHAQARSRPTSGWQSLTRTEERIAGHVATGQTNLEIAQSLFISRRTVETHVSNVLAKLGLRSRTEIAIRFAHRVEESR